MCPFAPTVRRIALISGFALTLGVLTRVAGADTRIEVALVSGYFDRRERIWTEPLYRNLHGLLLDFGDAEIAQLVVPRTLIAQQTEIEFFDGTHEIRAVNTFKFIHRQCNWPEPKS